MRLIHTADWHLGQRFFGWDRIDEQRHALIQLKEILRKTEADALLVAGDIFDTVNPSSEAERLYYNFLAEIRQENPSLEVVITAGNHDSPYRLNAPASLLHQLGIKVVSTVQRTAQGIPDYSSLIHVLKGKGGSSTTCLSLPYLRPGDFSFLSGEENKMAQFIDKAYKEALSLNHPVVIMAHLYISGASFKSMEEGKVYDTIGNEEAVSLSFFPSEATYIALGHIHKPQKIGGYNHIRYAGSLLPNSFTEKDYTHGVLQVDIDSRGHAETQLLEIEPPAKLQRVCGTEETLKKYLLDLPEKAIDYKAPYLQLLLESEEPRPDLLSLFRTEVRGKYVRLANIVLKKKPSLNNKLHSRGQNITLKERSPLEIAQLVYKENNDGSELPEDLIMLFKKVEDSLQIK